MATRRRGHRALHRPRLKAILAQADLKPSARHVAFNPAQLGSEHAKYAWRFFEYAWKPAKPGGYTLMSRASDSLGRVQPMQAAWNPSGYLWNGIDQVNVHVEA